MRGRARPVPKGCAEALWPCGDVVTLAMDDSDQTLASVRCQDHHQGRRGRKWHRLGAFVGLSRLQTHGISRPALVSRGASSSIDRHVREGPTFFLYFCIIFCISGQGKVATNVTQSVTSIPTAIRVPVS